MEPAAGLIVARGVRATEEALAGDLDRLLAAAEAEPALLARPVRVVVPSRSLRRHLAAALVRRRGRSAAGVEVATLAGTAREILERAGEPAGRAALLADVVPQRLARGEKALSRGLDDLVDGYGVVAASVRDLLDAGFEPALAPALEEALAGDGPAVATRDEVERARALLRLATLTWKTLRATGVQPPSVDLARAAELLHERGAEALPARAVLVHGFADATGVATDLLQALAGSHGARFYLDRPPRPGSPDEDDERELEGAFGERFGECFGGRLRAVTTPADLPGRPAALPPPRATPELFVAGGAAGEVRELAVRLRELLDAGERPEGIAIVARDLAPYRLEVRRAFLRQGIPFSGLGERGSLTPRGRRLHALLDLLRQREATPAERWLDALERLPGTAPGGTVEDKEEDREDAERAADGIRLEVRLALYALGKGRLRDVAGLDLGPHLRGGRYPLPLRQGLEAAEDGSEEDAGPASRAPRRSVAGGLLRAVAESAGRLRARLASWPAKAPAGEHLRRLAELLGELGWPRPEAAGSGLPQELAPLAAELPPAFELTFDELRQLLARRVTEAGRSDLGGKGGGVQVLSVIEARARSFDHLFVLGLNRDAFPRTVREDPLLPDPLRAVLRRLLPDLALKRTGFDEERYLFAQLLTAAPRVTLSFQDADDEGSPRSPSPLLERQIGERPPLAAAHRARSPWVLPSSELRPAHEHAVLAGLHGSREHFAGVLALALRSALASAQASTQAGDETAPPPHDAAHLAAARLAVLAELDPDLGTETGRATARELGPYFGLVGPPTEEADPRRRRLHVTHVERTAGCPWQLFLTRLLGIEPTPDPLQALPGVDALLLGNAVHRVLQAVAGRGLEEAPRSLTEALAAPATPVAWPAPGELEALVRRETRALVAEAGMALPGIAEVLARLVRPFLATARESDWSAPGGVAVAGVEVEGSLEPLGPGSRPLFFRADRVDQPAPSEVRLTDYKTGRSRWDYKRPETRARHLLAATRSGEWLQAVAYRLAAGEGAVGRYLFLHPDTEYREYAVSGDDGELEAAFREAVRAVLALWDTGAFFPRLVDPSGEVEPKRCEYCPVAEACLRGDSGARGRLVAWATPRAAAGTSEGVPAEPPPPAAAAALLDVFHLAPPARKSPGSREGGGEEG